MENTCKPQAKKRSHLILGIIIGIIGSHLCMEAMIGDYDLNNGKHMRKKKKVCCNKW